MKAIILLGTLKEKGTSNTQVLTEFAVSYLEKQDIECEVIRLAEHNIVNGTYTDMGAGDDWPGIYQKVVAADIYYCLQHLFGGTVTLLNCKGPLSGLMKYMILSTQVKIRLLMASLVG